MLVRLNKYIADCGLCSRRKADEYILNDKVKVNGKVTNELGLKIDDKKDEVTVCSKKLKPKSKNIYLMLNKPKGYVTTASDEFGRKTVLDLIHEDTRVYPIGRLDMDTEGMLLLTNDGTLANTLTHPKHNITKTYIVTTSSKITKEKIETLKNGVDIGGYVTKQASVKKLNEKQIQVIISEGKNRQIRKMCEFVNINVVNLARVKIGNLELGNLKVGKYRHLSLSEIKSLKQVEKI